MDWMDWTQIATILAGSAVLVFILTYMVIARWWRSQEGQTIVILSVLIVLAASIGITRRYGFPAIANVMAIVVWSGVFVVYLWLTALLLRAQGVHRVMNLRRHQRGPAPDCKSDSPNTPS